MKTPDGCVQLAVPETDKYVAQILESHPTLDLEKQVMLVMKASKGSVNPHVVRRLLCQARGLECVMHITGDGNDPIHVYTYPGTTSARDK
jgi:hypothetical protein